MLINNITNSFNPYKNMDRTNIEKPTKLYTTDTVSFKSIHQQYSHLSEETVQAFWKELLQNKGTISFKVVDATYTFTIPDFDIYNYKEQPIAYQIKDEKANEIARGFIKTPINATSKTQKRIYYSLLPKQYSRLRDLAEKFIRKTNAPRQDIINDLPGSQYNKMQNFLDEDPNKIYTGAQNIVNLYSYLESTYQDKAVLCIDMVYKTINDRYLAIEKNNALEAAKKYIKNATPDQLKKLMAFLKK